MGKTIPFRIDTELVHHARSAALVHDRTPTAQIEHWAKLGRVLDSVLSGKSVAGVKHLSRIEELDDILAMTQTPAGQERARALIASQRGPIYTADPDRPGVILEKRPDGTVRAGKFINREFVAVADKKKRARTRTDSTKR